MTIANIRLRDDSTMTHAAFVDSLKSTWPVSGDVISCAGCCEALWRQDVWAAATDDDVLASYCACPETLQPKPLVTVADDGLVCLGCGEIKQLREVLAADGSVTFQHVLAPVYFCRQCCDDGTVLEMLDEAGDRH